MTVIVVLLTGEALRLKDKTYSLVTLLRLSQEQASYEWLCCTFLGCIVGYKAWNKKRAKERISQIATCSDEAFLLLTLENNYQRWLCEAEWTERNKGKEPDEKEPKVFPAARYTNSGLSRKDGRSRRLQGWAREGYLHFNELYQLVAKDCGRRLQFELRLLDTMRDSFSVASSSTKDVQDAENEIFPANDLFGVELADPNAEESEDDSDESENESEDEESDDNESVKK